MRLCISLCVVQVKALQIRIVCTGILKIFLSPLNLNLNCGVFLVFKVVEVCRVSGGSFSFRCSRIAECVN